MCELPSDPRVAPRVAFRVELVVLSTARGRQLRRGEALSEGYPNQIRLRPPQQGPLHMATWGCVNYHPTLGSPLGSPFGSPLGSSWSSAQQLARGRQLR